ncbi:MAG: DUF262 domain-containing protein, partial [Alphaproteobacteria bacterium]|nr:DUF262 domain-containing protein [Alphaproteobacteria bacterium]
MSDNVKLNPFNFTSEVYSLDRLMAGGVQNDLGLVIPDYQRGYTWEQEEVERLFIDILISLINRSSEPSGHFLGATVWNLRRRAEETDFSVPSYDIVDGQQRITTCLLLTINLLFSIRAGHAQVKADTTIPTELLNWLNAEISQVETQASQMLVGDIKFGDDYPRLIYEQDVRAKEHSHSEYNSPIAKLILSTFSSLNTGQLKPDFGAITVK